MAASEWSHYLRSYAQLEMPQREPEPGAAACAQCPAFCMDREVWEALRDEPPEIREAVHARGHCHMQPSRQCRGGRAVTEGRA